MATLTFVPLPFWTLRFPYLRNPNISQMEWERCLGGWTQILLSGDCWASRLWTLTNVLVFSVYGWRQGALAKLLLISVILINYSIIKPYYLHGVYFSLARLQTWNPESLTFAPPVTWWKRSSPTELGHKPRSMTMVQVKGIFPSTGYATAGTLTF